MTWSQRRALLMGGQVAFAPAGEPAGGGGDPDPDPTPSPDPDPADPQPGGSILDLAKPDDDKPDPDAEPGDYKAPDFVAEHLRGKDADETLEKIHTAYKGARDKLAKGTGALEGEVPDAADAYSFSDQGTEEEPDKVFAELSSEASKPLVDMAKAAAHKMGIPDKAFEGFMREFVQAGGEAGIPFGLSDEEAEEISAEAEMEKLTEITGSGAEASTMVNTVMTYAQKMVDRGVMTKEQIGEFKVMVGTAESVQIFYNMLVGEMGERPIPPGDPDTGTVTPQEAYAMHEAAAKMPDGAEKDQAMAEANKAMNKAYGQNPTGSVPSNVL